MDDQGDEEYYLYDGLGSVTGICDDTGTVIATYEYDVFGAPRATTGSSANEFTFAGEQTDPTELQFLRARYYDPAVGRFLSEDPLGLPQRYPYAANNPVTLTDPTGLWPSYDDIMGPIEDLRETLERINYEGGNFDPRPEPPVGPLFPGQAAPVCSVVGSMTYATGDTVSVTNRFQAMLTCTSPAVLVIEAQLLRGIGAVAVPIRSIPIDGAIVGPGGYSVTFDHTFFGSDWGPWIFRVSVTCPQCPSDPLYVEPFVVTTVR